MSLYFRYFILTFLFLSGCAKEIDYRGVPEPEWQHLNAEQRQLIVDQSYEEIIQQRGRK